jgi:hypothetical protein
MIGLIKRFNFSKFILDKGELNYAFIKGGGKGG